MDTSGHNTFVLNPLHSEMQCGILSDPTGSITIVHEGKLASEIQWVDFDPANKTLSIVHEDGKTQDLGIPLTENSCANISHGMEVSLICIKNGKAMSIQRVVFLLKDY